MAQGADKLTEVKVGGPKKLRLCPVLMYFLGLFMYFLRSPFKLSHLLLSAYLVSVPYSFSETLFHIIRDKCTVEIAFINTALIM